MTTSSVRPQIGGEMQVGPSGKTLLPLSVRRPAADMVGAGSDAARPTAVPRHTTAVARRDQG